MRTAVDSHGAGAVARPGALQGAVIVVHLLAVSVFVQAILAGQWLVNADIIRSHGWLGSVSWLLGIAEVALVLVAGITGRYRMVLLGISVLLVLLMTAQLGLGYAGRDNSNLAAIHIPNGVLIFGLVTANISLALRARRELHG